MGSCHYLFLWEHNRREVCRCINSEWFEHCYSEGRADNASAKIKLEGHKLLSDKLYGPHKDADVL